MEQIKYWVAFHRIRGLGPLRFQLLEARFSDMAEAWNAPAQDLGAAGLDQRTVHEVVEARRNIDPDEEMARLERAGIAAVHRRSGAYPDRLGEIYDPPSVLYVLGALTPDDHRSVAVVGTRTLTPYGREVARRLSGALAENGVTVISGLARGIDGIAHEAALDHGGRTIAVVGGGLDRLYPAEHRNLARRIENQGAVISEYPLGARPDAQNFPRRNRIISGLSLGVVVVEAGLKSGALLTVYHALEQNREVFAVPGSILSERSAGTNWLIQQGAKAVVDHRDILEELNIAGLGQQLRMEPAEKDGPELDEVEERLLGQLSAGPMHVDEITRVTGLASSVVSSTFTMMELRGLVRQAGPMQYVSIIEKTAAGQAAR